MNSYFERTELLVGSEGMAKLSSARVIIFGTGGVGSWCAEALARNGIGHMTLVDDDTVATSNVNRQLPAFPDTVGRLKAQLLAERFERINPNGDFTALPRRYTPQTASDFNIETYDYVIDAIDSVPDKADLILRCTDPSTAPRRAFFSSMGAARKGDISRIATAEFYKAIGCPLARALRDRFRKTGMRPRHKFKVVYSPERLEQPVPSRSNGTLAYATAAFGLMLAQLTVQHILR